MVFTPWRHFFGGPTLFTYFFWAYDAKERIFGNCLWCSLPWRTRCAPCWFETGSQNSWLGWKRWRQMVHWMTSCQSDIMEQFLVVSIHNYKIFPQFSIVIAGEIWYFTPWKGALDSVVRNVEWDNNRWWWEWWRERVWFWHDVSMLPTRFGHTQTIVGLDMFCCGSHLPSLKLTFSHLFKGMLGIRSRFLLGPGLFSGANPAPNKGAQAILKNFRKKPWKWTTTPN